MSGWPRGVSWEFSLDENKSGSPQEGYLGDEEYLQLMEPGISFPVWTSIWAAHLLVYIFVYLSR